MDIETDKQKILREFAEKYQHCWACGWPSVQYRYVEKDIWNWLEIHHIVKLGRVHETWNLSRFCERCHRLAELNTIRDSKTKRVLPYLRRENVLWLKNRFDNENYNRKELDAKALGKLECVKRPAEFFGRQYEANQRRAWPGVIGKREVSI